MVRGSREKEGRGAAWLATMAGEVFKPRTDKREYRRVVLQNSLQVLLISDPDTDKAAASMDVGVGSFSDPEGLEGLAHFLEHMLFYSSEKYPVEDSYSKYIVEHGGSTNAFTASENTNFHFDVNADSLFEALDRFAQFFIKPLMSPDATSREIKAVDSEHQKNLLSDHWRISQLQKHLSKKDHPFHKFSTGNFTTLDVDPKSRGLDTREELIALYEKSYSANLMHLVVYGKENLDELQNFIEFKFNEIQNKNLSPIRFPGRPCALDHLQVLVKTVPIRQGHKLVFSWPVNPSIHHYKEGPCRYVGHLIGHEGEGSLFSVLKKLGWASSLNAGEDFCGWEFSFFEVSVSLTDAGHENMGSIVGLVFQYIHLLQELGIQKWIHEELMTICEMGFHYQDKIPPFEYVVDIASNMQFYPPEDWLVGSSLPCKFTPEIIQLVLNELSPSNLRIFWKSKNFEGKTDKVEPWYGTAYSVEKISNAMIQEWTEAAPIENLHLRGPNIFIPMDLELKTTLEKDKYPVLLRTSPYSKLWYKPDTKFYTPKAYFKVVFTCPESTYSPEAEVLTILFTRLLVDYLNEYAYDAEVAGLYYGIHSSVSGFKVRLLHNDLIPSNWYELLRMTKRSWIGVVDYPLAKCKVSMAGYNHKMNLLLGKIMEKIAQFEVKADRFSVIKETLMKDYQNLKFQQPYEQALYYCSLILEDQMWHWTDVLEVLRESKAEHLATFVPRMLSKTFLKCYVSGNIKCDEAELMIRQIEDLFFDGIKPLSRPLFRSEYLARRIIKLQKNVNYLYPVKVLNECDENSALLHYIQVHQDDLKMNVKVQLFSLIASQPVFHQLRSVEQLGYITRLTNCNYSGIRGLQFIVQSTAKDPAHIDIRVEEFLKTFESKMNDMTSDEFKNNKNALIDLKLEKDKNLWEESGFYWHEIEAETLKFDRIECEVAHLRDLSQEDFKDFFNTYVRVGAPRSKSLSIQIYGARHTSEYKAVKFESQSEHVRIDDIYSFKRSRPLYSSLSGHLFGV